MKKKVLSLILSVLMICLTAQTAFFTTFAEEKEKDETITPTENWLTENLGEDGKTLYINNANDLLAFANALVAQPTAQANADLASDQFHDKTVLLTKDINLNPTWSASSEKPTNAWPDVSYRVFTGVFDGNGYTISGIHMKVLRTANNHGGIFGCARSYDGKEVVTVKNLAITNSYVESGINSGSIFGSIPTNSNVLLENLYVNVDVNITKDGSKSNDQASNGGLVGHVAGTTTLTIKNTIYAGTIDVTSIKLRNIGGFVGRANQVSTISIENSAYYGTIKTSGDASAGLLARTESDTVVYTVKNCIVAGTIDITNNTRGFDGSFYGQLYKELKTKIRIENSLYSNLTIDGTLTDQPIPTYSDLPDCLDPDSSYYHINNADITGVKAQIMLINHGLTDWATTAGFPIPRVLNEIIPENESILKNPAGPGEQDDAEIRFVGYQLSDIKDDRINIRLIGVTDSLDYEKVGFRVTANFVDQENMPSPSKDYSTTTVYQTLTGFDGKEILTYSAKDYNGVYFFALNCTNVNTKLGRVKFQITTFHVANGETTDDATYAFTVDDYDYFDSPNVQTKIPRLTLQNTVIKETYSCGNDLYEVSGTSATAEDLIAYRKRLTAEGFALHTENSIGANRFATYCKGDAMVHLCYYPNIQTVKCVFGKLGYLPETQAPTYSSIAEPSITQLGRKGASESAAGMSYVVQLADGSYIIIDGGPSNDEDSADLLNFLKANNPNEGKPQITWMITHADQDHMNLANDFLEAYHDEVTVNMVCYNFPDFNTINISQNQTSAPGALKRINTFESQIKQFYPSAKTFVFHAGQKLYLPGCEIEILYTHEDQYPNSTGYINHTCSAWRMKIFGKTVMILGDCEKTLCQQMADVYGTELKSDILQVSHHGLNGACLDLYKAIDPSICLWPIDETRFLTDSRCTGADKKYDFNAWLRQDSNRTHYSSTTTVTLTFPDLQVRE